MRPVCIACITCDVEVEQKKELNQLRQILQVFDSYHLKGTFLFSALNVKFPCAREYQEDQMKDAYVNYTETEFVDFLLRHTSLDESKLICTAKDGRHIFKLSKNNVSLSRVRN